jgi:hypothetical protein
MVKDHQESSFGQDFNPNTKLNEAKYNHDSKVWAAISLVHLPKDVLMKKLTLVGSKTITFSIRNTYKNQQHFQSMSV